MGLKLFIRRYGQGFPVIILHGLFGLSDNWVSFGRRLAADFDVIIPDLRNHGQSPHDPILNYNTLAGDVEEMIQDLLLQECFIIGHSMGGKTSVQLAVNYPEKLKKLVVVDIGLRKYASSLPNQELIKAMLEVDFLKVRSRSEVDFILKDQVPDFHLRQFLLKNIYYTKEGSLNWRFNLNAIRGNLHRILDSVEPRTPVNIPALFIRGAKSEYIREEDMEGIKHFFPEAQFRTIESAGHWVHADAPEEFFSVVWEFLRRKEEYGNNE